MGEALLLTFIILLVFALLYSIYEKWGWYNGNNIWFITVNCNCNGINNSIIYYRRHGEVIMNYELKSTKINKELKRKGLIDYITICLDDLSYSELRELIRYLRLIERGKHERTTNQSD